MLKAINFPNLGLNFESVGYRISIFGIEISYYGILLALAIILGVCVILMEARYTGQHPEDYLELAIFALPAAIIGARLYYVIFSWSTYKSSLGRIFRFWEGGYAFYGGLFAAILVIVIFANLRQMWTAEVLDTATIGLVLGQAVASFGSFFNREGFGEYTDGLFAMQLPIEALRIADVTDKMRNHIIEIEGVRFVQVSPLFFYQFVLCMVLFVVLLIHLRNKEFDGEIFLIFIAVESAFRIWMEGVRTDALCLPFFQISVSRVVAVILLLVSVVGLIYNHRMDGKGRMRRIRQKNAVLGVNEFENLFHNR